MNKNTGFAFLAITFVLLASGCTTQEATVSQSFIGGTEGLKMAFLEGAPPAVVYDGGVMDFSVNVMLENVGEYDIPADKVKVTIVGVDPIEFGPNTDNIVIIEEPIPGKSFGPEHNIVPGGIVYADLSNPAWNYLGNVSGDVSFPFRADVCYEYGTVAQGFICVKDDLTDSDVTSGDSVCLANEAKIIENSGAPIHILNLAESAAGSNSIAFTFEISHRGSGLISNTGSWCDDSIGNKSVVQITVDTTIAGTLDCTQLTGNSDGYASGSVQLFNGKRTIRCTQDLGDVTSDYEKIVDIKLSYDYKEHTTTDVTVRHSG